MSYRTLVSTKDLSREEWLEERRKGIGGSDSPALLLDDYKWGDPLSLYLDKIGEKEPEEDNAAMMRGRMLEPMAIDLYREKTGRNLRRKNAILQDAEYPFLIANIDSEIVGTDKGPGIAEVKCPGLWVFRDMERKGLPQHYQIQLQHYMGVMDREWGAFVVFSAELWKMIHFDVERDDAVIDLIRKEGAEFWEHVQTKTPPPARLIDLDLPEIGGGELVTCNTPEWALAIKEMKEARDLLSQAKDLEEGAKQNIQELMTAMGASVVEGGGGRIYWKEQNGRRSFDYRKFQKDHPDMDLEKYFKISKASRPFKPYFI